MKHKYRQKKKTLNVSVINQLRLVICYFILRYIIAESNCGKTIVSNLKPICLNYNSSMCTINMKSLK